MKFKENPVLDGVCAVKLYDLVKLEGQTPKGFSVELRISEIKGEKMNKVVVVDFGSQYSQLIVRKIRELGFYSEIISCNDIEEYLADEKISALILSGGPESVYEENSPSIPAKYINSDIPVLGICYGMQLITHLSGGVVKPSGKREFGYADIKIKKNDIIFDGFSDTTVWMSHGDSVDKIPDDFEVLASTDECPFCVIKKQNIYGIQFHPEVAHTKEGKIILSNFLTKIAGIKPDWTMDNYIEHEIEEIREKTHNKKVICAISGGVDSTVMTALLAHAVGERLTAIYIDNGLMRKGETDGIKKAFKQGYNFNLEIIDASQVFLQKLSGVTDPEKKRKIIGNTFIEVFEKEAEKIGAEFLAQGTLYPDVIESISYKGPSHVIKSHHNVGGLPEKMNLKIIEPFRTLFKDEVREIGKKLNLPSDVINRHPFPGPGLAVRILGDITEEKLRILNEADYIMTEEIKKAGWYDKIWQALAVLTPVKTVGVMGDQRTYEHVLALRMVDSVDGMTADFIKLPYEVLGKISSRIVSEVKGINRVVYDITSKPPATIEWE